MKIETIQLTGDAFYLLRDNEEPIDPDNIEEAEDLKQMFQPSFLFISEPEPVQGTDMVEVKISIAERHKIAGTHVVDFTPLPDKKVKVYVFDIKYGTIERNQIQDLEPIGDAYWAEYMYHPSSKTRNLLQVCKISEYEKWFG